MKRYKICLVLLLFCGTVNAQLSVRAVNATNGLNNGGVDLSVSGGYPPYRYIWSGPNNYSALTEDIGNLAPGRYCVNVSDAYCGQDNICVIARGIFFAPPPVYLPFFSIFAHFFRCFEIEF